MCVSLTVVALLLLCVGAPCAVANVVGVQIVGERVFPTETLGASAAAGALQLGGLTGLTYDHAEDRWFAVETRSAPATAYCTPNVRSRCPSLHVAVALQTTQVLN